MMTPGRVLDGLGLEDTFAESTDLEEILRVFSEIKANLGLSDQPERLQEVFSKLQRDLSAKIPHRYSELFRLLKERSTNKEYCQNTVASGLRVLILGGGPSGLRMALETQFLGARTTVIESRHSLDRNNVVKLWGFVMEDLRSLGAKKLYPQFGNGAVNHISIRMLQLILLKMVLLLGAAVHSRETFLTILPPVGDHDGWQVVTEVRDEAGGVSRRQAGYDVVISATGRKVPVMGFHRKSLEAKMSIAITANFVNNKTSAERKVEEIPGLSKQYHQEFFRKMEAEAGLRLENFVYFKDLTHYFVMTVKKDSLVRKGVIKNDNMTREDLLQPSNIDLRALEALAVEAAQFSTGYFSTRLPVTQFASWKGRNDVSIFDFTNLHVSKNASQVLSQGHHSLLIGLVGDSLIEPFWPDGTGIGQGFLSVLDTAWMVRRWAEMEERERVGMMDIIMERERLYCLLRQTGPRQLKTAWSSWTINPSSRYLPRQVNLDCSYVTSLHRDRYGDHEDNPTPTSTNI